VPPFPLPLDAYPAAVPGSVWATLAARASFSPFSVLATAIFLLAILHTFAAPSITRWAHRLRHDEDTAPRAGGPRRPRVRIAVLELLGEVEVVFGVWAAVLLVAIALGYGWSAANAYVNEGVTYTEPMFVVVIMALASSRPIVGFAEAALRRVAAFGGGTPGAWWLSILTLGPFLGSFITEPGAMTIAAVLLARQFYDLEPSRHLKYATLGLLFVNVSVGGTLTHFAAPPVLMVARPWGWDTTYMLTHFGWRTALAVLASNLVYFIAFKREFVALAAKAPRPDAEEPEVDGASRAPHDALLPVPVWIVAAHMLFMAWTVVNAHSPVSFVGGFLFFLGFVRATASYQSRIDLRSPLLVGFFLAGLVVHGGLQAWWIAPVLAALPEQTLFVAATILTGFNDNALVTYLATLAPNFSEPLQLAVVQGAVTGGGLTVIANAPNPAGQAILGRFFGTVSPLWLLAWAIPPTLIVTVAFRLL
jgi:Putative Na+/H+ antiporter